MAKSKKIIKRPKPEIKKIAVAKFPRHNIEKSLRIPKAIIDQNASKECSDVDAAKYVGVGLHGPFSTEISSAIKFGFLTRPNPGMIAVTDRARKAIRPQQVGDDIDAFREAILAAPDIKEVYSHYRGENLPDGAFLDNALVDTFGLPKDKVQEFKEIFFASLESARLTEKVGDKIRVLDATHPMDPSMSSPIKVKAGSSKAQSGDSCFVVMPFAAPIGSYFKEIYQPAIEKVGLKAVRADADIFGTGKIIDQIWRGINEAKVLVAELTSRNPNVFYELGLAHALEKPVVLVSSKSNQDDVPFDLRHIRVIYYDVTDPFWGKKLMDKVAENIQSALENPKEAVFARILEQKL